MKLLILAPYPLGKAPSQRFRFEHFIKSIEEKGWKWDFQSFVSTKGWELLYKPGFQLQKIMVLVSGFLRRKLLLFRIHQFDFILLHRELTPFGPPIFEWIIAKVLRKKIIYDFDDAIWLSDQKVENKLWQMLKWRSKIAAICSWSWKVSVGNDYLAAFAAQHCDSVVVLPTVVDTSSHKPINPTPYTGRRMPTIGWTGSHSTLFYLDTILPILQELENKRAFEFVVIANKDPQLRLKNYRFIKWNKDTEISDLATIDLGIMPLEDTEWAKGKCGFKLIQYLALGIASVASPVGVNTKIIEHGETGFLANNREEWEKYLLLLLENEPLRKAMGEKGRKTIVDHYSVQSQEATFLGLFK